MSKVHLVSYANEPYEFSMKQLELEAREFNLFDKFHMLSPDYLDKSFQTKFSHILNQPRGAGYWIWRPYILKKLFETEIAWNDKLVFLNAGCK